MAILGVAPFDRVERDPSAWFDHTSDWTKFFRFAVTTETAPNYRTLWHVGDPAFADPFMGVYITSDPNEVYFEVGEGVTLGDDLIIIPPSSWPNSGLTWHDVAVTYEAADTRFRFYYDGVELGTDQFDISTFPPFDFEAHGSDSASEAVGVKFTDERLWQRTLTLLQIQSERTSPVPVSSANLLSASPLKTITDLDDTVGAHDWTGVGSIATTPGPYGFYVDDLLIDILGFPNSQAWRISEHLNERNTMTFGVKSMDASYRPPQRGIVNFLDDAALKFAGIIYQRSETGLGGYGVVPIVTVCNATDFNVLPSHRQVAVSLAAGTLKSMLATVQTYLDDYGVTLDPEQADGDSFDDLVFELGPLTEVLNKLSVISGWAWEITYDRLLRMFPPGDVAAPINIADNDGNVLGDLTVSPTTTNYANRVYVFAGTGTKDVEDHFVGDGVEDTFPLTYTPASLYGYVTVNAVVETLGPGATWEYEAGTNSITRTAGAPANLDAITITYVGSFPYVAMAEDVPAQDGGINLVEKTFTAPDVMDATTAQAMAAGYLAQSLAEPREIRYTTSVSGIRPGMSQHITCSGRDLDADCLITAVETYPVGKRHKLRYDVTAVEGLVIVPGFIAEWREMTGAATAGPGSGGSFASGLIDGGTP